MPPTNTSKATAMEITSLPFDIVEDANDSGVTKDLWFFYTKQVGDEVLQALGTGGGTAYTPELIVVLADDTPFIESNPETPVQVSFAVAFEPTIWFQCHNINGNHAPAVLTFNVQRGPTLPARVGDLFIPDDQTEGTGFPGAILDPLTGELRRYVASCPNGESGDILPTGEMLLQDVGDVVFVPTPSMKLLRHDFVQIASFTYANTPGTTDRPCCRLSDGSAFYSTEYNNITTWTLNHITPLGVKTVKDSITGTTLLTAICPNVANTVLYLSGKTGSTDSVIYQWDLVGHAYTTNFAAAVAGYVACHGILTLSDGRVVAVYQKNTVTKDLLVKVYNAAGAVLVSQSFGSDILSGFSRIFYDLNDPGAFWLRKIQTGNVLVYHKLKTNDLTDLVTPFTTQAFQEGWNQSTASPLVRGQSSITCAGLVLRVAETTTQTFTIRRQRRFLLPSSDNNYQMSIPTMELLARTGIGLTPDTAWDGSTPTGVDPQVMTRISKDGGKTWSPKRWTSAGTVGAYLRRVRILQATGHYRNAVFEVTVSDPVDWQFLSAMGIPIEGSS